jgi:pimeloyl-ACP methyl ester carboxylesterase
MHAQDCDMMEYVANDPAPAFILAELGYDVWFGNNRGSQFSHAHQTLDRHSKQYWDFYQEDMARQDLPTIIDHILEKTGKDQLTYIGHSEGTTQFFLGASLLPDYFASKVNLFVGLAPVASTANIPSPMIRKAAAFIKEIELALMVKGLYNLFPPMTDAIMAEEFFCTLPYLDGVCKEVMGMLHHEGVDSPSAGETFLSHEPSGQSWRTFSYYA